MAGSTDCKCQTFCRTLTYKIVNWPVSCSIFGIFSFLSGLYLSKDIAFYPDPDPASALTLIRKFIRQTMHRYMVVQSRNHRYRYGTDTIRYDTIRDVILTRARKPTWVSLIYRTETTTKKCKNWKTKRWKVKKDMLRSNSKSLRNPCSQDGHKKTEDCEIRLMMLVSMRWNWPVA